MSAPVLLTVERLTVCFAAPGGEVHAVRGLDLRLPRGGSLALVGESGCGKSVTALAIMGLLPPSARVGGRIFHDGVELLALAESRRRAYRGRRLAMVFQDPAAALNPVLTVGEQVAEGLRHHERLSRRAAWDRAVTLLEEVRLPDAAARARDYPHRLSGGMQQRVVLAAALACTPELLVADEPTTALDVTVQAQILTLLRELVAARGMSLLYITHDLALVPGMAARVAVLYAGQVMEEGPTAAVLARPGHPYTRALLAALPERWPLEGPPDLAAEPFDPRKPAPGCPYASRCEFARAACRAAPPPRVPVAVEHAAHCQPEVVAALRADEAAP